MSRRYSWKVEYLPCYHSDLYLMGADIAESTWRDSRAGFPRFDDAQAYAVRYAKETGQVYRVCQVIEETFMIINPMDLRKSDKSDI